MNDFEKQFRRVERALGKVLDDRDRDPVEYEDDVWCFIQGCWHLTDWMQSEESGLHKAIRSRVESDVNSFWKMVLLGDLTNRTRNVRTDKRESDADIRNRELRIGPAPAKTHWEYGAQEPAEDSGKIVLAVVDNMNLVYPVRDLAKDAMRIWHKLFKVYGLSHLLVIDAT